MRDNCPLLGECVDGGLIRLPHPQELYRTPVHLPADFDFERVEGLLLGLAIGDALGAPTEGMTPAERHDRHGEIRDYLPSRVPEMGALGAGTDDTQLAFWTLEELIEDGGLVPEHLSDRFCCGRIYGMGSTMSQFVERRSVQGLPWQLAGVDSLGNGALMRIAPVLIPHLQLPHPSLYADAALDTMLTHNAPGSIAACVAFVEILWQLLGMRRTPEPAWWFDTFAACAGAIEGVETHYRVGREGAGSYVGPLAAYVRQTCHAAYERRLPIVDACNAWGSGAYLMETVPSALYILAMHGHDPETAITRAVNDTMDNDTIAAIVGAAVGALHGLAGLPGRWTERLDGRVRADGRGDVFRLIFRAKQAFWLHHS